MKYKNSNHDTYNERIIFLIDLTIREPHTEKFVFSENRMTQGEAATKGDTEKEFRYRFLTANANMNCRLFYLSLESNGHVSEKTHDLYSLLKSFGSSERILSAIKKNVAGAVAYKNGTVLAKYPHLCIHPLISTLTYTILYLLITLTLLYLLYYTIFFFFCFLFRPYPHLYYYQYHRC